MRKRFKTMLTVILLLIIACGAMGGGYVLYSNELKAKKEAVVVVDGAITINYLNGNEFMLKDNGKLQFSVTNNSTDQAYYYIQFSDVKGNLNDITYEIKSDSNDLNIKNELKAEIISNYISIEGNKTDSYTIEFKSDSSDMYSGKLIVGIKENEHTTFADVILDNNSVNQALLSTLGENAEMDEGLIQSADDLGMSYYFRGDVKNNYVSFAGETWRIVRINGDGSVKLVLNNTTDVLTKYYDDKYEFVDATINKSLDSWYDIKLANYSKYIASYKFCNDLVFDEDATTSAAYSRIATNKIPTFMCLGTSSNDKIGLLTADEVMLAGGSMSTNTKYYLYNSNINTEYYTMTSANMNGKYHPFAVTSNGALTGDVDGTLLRGLRPVINIVKTAKATGTGTSEDPYIIETE